MRQYDHKKIEKRWQKEWEKKKAHVVKDKVAGKKNEYLLVEFAYPSGNLHVGHWYAFAVPDIYGRFRRAQGRNVLYPMGFDAFGLPAENAAIKNKLNPRTWTYANIKHMKGQLASMGASFDWSREVITCDPDYYRWTQWQFLQFYKKGLAYQKETAANWCPNDKTVLANEQVVNGRCERCGAEVEQRQMVQWNLKITDYADRLIDDLTKLDWPEQIKESQRNWIGRSEGAQIDFFLNFENQIFNDRIGPTGKKAHVTAFTTRPDTLYGATYVVLAPEQSWLTRAVYEDQMLKNNDEVKAYIEKTKKRSDLERQENKEKSGIRLEGVSAINPATGEKIPVFVADYVLGSYGTGVVMAVPAHDERDFEFAKKFDLPIKAVIEPMFTAKNGEDAVKAELPLNRREAVVCVVKHWSEDKYLCLKWKKVAWSGFVTGGIDGSESKEEAGKREILEETGYKNVRFIKELGQVVNVQFYHVLKKENRWARFQGLLFELTDSEQEQISEEEKDIHDIHWLNRDEVEKFLSVGDMKLIWDRAMGKESAYTGSGILVSSSQYDGLANQEAKKSITEKFGRAKKTYRLRDWGVSRQRYWGVPIPIIHCDDCGAVPVPDKDLPVKLPEVKDYLPAGDGKSPLAKATKWVNVKCPQCKGKAMRETDTLDTFVDSSWYFLRYTDPKNKKQFANKKKQATWMPIDLYSGGAEHTTMHLLYSRFWHKALYDLKLVGEKEPYTRRMNRGLILGPDGAKMSKSKGNVIDPDAVVAQLGADTVRLYLAFIGPYNEAGSYPWNPDSIVGVRRFLERVWRLGQLTVDSKQLTADAEVERLLHKTIKKVGEDCAEMKFNTAISQMMIFVNTAESKGITRAQYATFVRLLAPFAPHITEELWHEIGNKKSVHLEPWPKYDKKKLVSDTVTIMIQINGKLRGEVRVAADADKDTVESAAKRAVADRLTDQTIQRTIVVPGRLVNFVVLTR
ncbi:class I tRNA ligase family protein [Candidatus Kaiserbacteria bacterium]|nr:class I tRNA ligase family protein [Candidatus Kaiserbacteria bacterium]